MKEGWEYKKLGELVKIRTGKLDANAADKEGLYPFFTCAVEPLRINQFAFDCECVLVAGNGDLNVKFYNGKFNAYQRTYVIEVLDKTVLFTRYLYQFYKLYIEDLRKQSVGSTIKYIKLGNLTNSVIPLPLLSEQQEIVSYLDSSFAKIDAMKANAEKSLNEAKALFQATLKEMLEPKEGWEEKTLGEIGELKNGMNFAKNESGNDIHLLGVGDFGNLFRIDDTDKLPIISLNALPSDEYLLKDNDIVFVRSNGNKNLVGRSVLINIGNSPSSFSGFCIRFRKSTDAIEANYLTYFLKTEDARKQLVGNGANISNLNQKILNQFIVHYPTLSEQHSIVTTLDSIKSKVDQLQANCDKITKECDAMKQAILRQVFE